jgi:uncharacterized protein (TIGR02466 family)
MVDAADFSATKFVNIFATPLLTHVWEGAQELNAALRERILAREAESGGVVKSNHGGWHSETGRLEFLGEPGERLVRHMIAFADEATRRVLAENGQQGQPGRWWLSAWANVNRNGDFNAVHVHPGSTWSGTYYVDAGGQSDAGGATPLQLFDPCQGRTTTTYLARLLPSSVFVRPKPGLMVLFPSYVPHMVFPHKGTGPRISIAFNLRWEGDR